MPYITQINSRNSFITFDDQTIYLTQRECAIVRPFCIPIFDVNDLSFQFTIDTDILDFEDVATNVQLISNENYINVALPSVNIQIIEDTLYMVQFQFASSDLLDSISIGDCFQFQISFVVDEPNLYLSTQCLQRVGDECFTSRLTYSNIESAFDFIYIDSFFNKIRLPIYFKNPVVQNDQKVYVRSDGSRKKLYAKLAKKWLGLVDMATEEIHQKLVVALSHDLVTFTTDNNYVLECTFEDEYTPNFPDVMQGINVWTANFNVMETPFDETNNNCG